MGHVWLEGDNLQNSTDSRYYGPIPYGLVRGRIFFKVQYSASHVSFILWARKKKSFSQNELWTVDLTVVVTTF
jgi:hypothetical protein